MRKALLTACAIIALEGCNFAAPAQAQDAQALGEAFCARPDLTAPQRITCASPRLKANAVRNLAAAIEVIPKLSPADQVELGRRIEVAAQQQSAYCHADAPNPQLPPSPAMEVCLSYWQDRTFADFQTLDQRIAQARAGQAVGGFLQGLGAVLGLALDAAGTAAGVAALSQPQPSGLTRTYCNGYGGHGGSYTYVCQ